MTRNRYGNTIELYVLDAQHTEGRKQRVFIVLDRVLEGAVERDTKIDEHRQRDCLWSEAFAGNGASIGTSRKHPLEG